MNGERAKYVDEAVEVRGPGVDFWHRPDDNNHKKLEEDDVRGRKSVRQRYLEQRRKQREASA